MNDKSVEHIFNDGERMVPFLSHNDDELVRHYGSHNFFRKVITEDFERLKVKDVTILDVGFGTGYACYLYSKLQNVSKVFGVEISKISYDWAIENFNNKKIDYTLGDAIKYLAKKDKYDYIVTRHVLEHIEDGLNIIKENKYSKRLCISVPYNEGEGNEFHILKGIQEGSFPQYKNVEFFYEDLEGHTYDKIPKGIFINSITFVASKDNLPKVRDYFKFPFKAPNIEDIFTDLTESNPILTRRIVSIQSQRLENLNTERQSLETENTELRDQDVKLKQEILKLKSELSAIYGSKKWQYSKKIADLKDTITRNGKVD